ncbi:LemA family protein [Bacteroides sp.]|uniref:LemA family protein n=1 Tax=Bacteroides sp. TaxID=29523 RepID=UPI00261BFC83|nr:LemA family protein [Bacteroides sp.]MDD3038525.1 LemA family protein [Bacteroides sp.]
MTILGILIAVCLLYIIGVYNTLIRKRNNIDNAFASIDVMLKKRFDLIPNLVATVKQYAKHEENIFSTVTEMRAKGYEQLNSEDKVAFDEAFTQASRLFIAVAESYPELKASDNFMHLQRTLNEVEEQLSAARRTFNANVTDYNNAVMIFPSNMIARIFGFTSRKVFSIPEEERENVNTKNLFQS